MRKLTSINYILPAVLVLLGLVTRFIYIWHPEQVVFDEVHFGKFVSAYFKGEYYFDIHPPLGKLLIAFVTYISGFTPGFTFGSIGEHYTDYGFVIMRALPNLFGALLPACVYFLVRSLRGSLLAAFFCGVAVLCENGLLAQSHFIFVDSMLLFFGFSGVILFFWYRNISSKPTILLISGVLIGCSFSVKWTGLSFLAIALGVCFLDFIYKNHKFRQFVAKCSVLLVVSILVYMTVFAVHFSLLHNSGRGDKFMSPGFLKTLEGSKYENDETITGSGYFEKFFELNKIMYLSNRNLNAEHHNSSQYYTWPVMKRSVYYWVESYGSDKKSRIYMLGNPFVWWTSLAALILGIVFWKPLSPEKKLFLYFGWLINFLPFVFIGRVMFLYHYFPALLFSIVIMSIFLFDDLKYNMRLKMYMFAGLVLLYVAGFLFFAPLTYGLPLSPEQYDLRMWLDSWK